VVDEWNETHGAELDKRYAMPSRKDLENFKTVSGHLTTLDHWKELFEKCLCTKLVGLDKSFPCDWFSLSWLLDPDKCADVMNGKWPKVDIPKRELSEKEIIIESDIKYFAEKHGESEDVIRESFAEQLEEEIKIHGKR